MKNARLAAFEILHGVFTGNAYANLALDSAIRDVAPGDRAFLSRLVMGTVERKLTLAYLLRQHLTSKPKPKVYTILLLSVYQLYFMEKVPSSAAINEGVRLAGEVGCAYYKGLINAVLHSVDDHRRVIEEMEDLSLRYSCPDALIRMWEKHYGRENTMKILSCINEKPPVFAVPNPLYVTAEELQYELLCDGIECDTADGLVIIPGSFELAVSRAFRNGLFHIEDKSSYECAIALGAQAGDTVLDLCAAPGGKAFTVAEGMHNEGRVYAYDIYDHRIGLINDGARRLGLTNITAALNDASVYNGEIPQADRILCDVPCSGFGIIRRKPEIRYKTLDSVKELPALQTRILAAAARYLKPGGRLVYSTCTLNKKENEKVVAQFLAQHDGFTLQYDRTVFPEKDGGDGFYYAVIDDDHDGY